MSFSPHRTGSNKLWLRRDDDVDAAAERARVEATTFGVGAVTLVALFGLAYAHTQVRRGDFSMRHVTSR